MEQVSWDDCQQFLEKLNEKIRGLSPRGGEVPVAYRGTVGICLPGGEHDAFLLRGRGVAAGRLCVVLQQLGE